MKQLTIQQVEIALKEMKELEKGHVKARILLDMETGGILISYPLPKNFWEINKIQFENKEINL